MFNIAVPCLLAGHAPFMPMAAPARDAAAEGYHGQAWIDAAFAAMDSKRQHLFKCLLSRTINFGSDCSGADSAFQAAKIWGEFVGCTQINKMCSEDPKAVGPMLFILLNHPPERMFLDVLLRHYSGEDLMSDGRAPVPKDLDIYSAGTVCTDFSQLNTHKPKQRLGHYRNYVFVLFPF